MKSHSAQDQFRPVPGVISCAAVTGSGCITYHAYATLLSGLKMSPETQQPPGIVFYFLQGSLSPCNLQNKLLLLYMPNSNTIHSVVFHCHGHTTATHYQHGITSKNTAHIIACTQIYTNVCCVQCIVLQLGSCEVIYYIMFVHKCILCVCIHEF